MKLLLGGFSRFALRGGVLLLKALDAAGGIDQLLLAGEERVAIRANFYAQHVAFDGRSRLEVVTAGAVNGDGMIVGVNTGFHVSPMSRPVCAASRPEPGPTGASLGRETIFDDTRAR